MKEQPSPEGCVLAMIWLPLLLVGSSTYRGFVLTKLWSWFIVPTFGLPVLLLPAAIGLALIVSFLPQAGKSSKMDESETLSQYMLKTTVNAALTPSLTLLAGYIVSRWM